MGPPAPVFPSTATERGSQLTFCTTNGLTAFIHPTACHFYPHSAKSKSSLSLPLLLMHLLHQSWTVILLEEINRDGLLFWKALPSQNRRPFRVLALCWVRAGCGGLYKRLHARLWQENYKMVQEGLALLFFCCVCVCVFLCGWEWKAASTTHRLCYESGSKLTAWWLDLISSHWISDSNLFLLRERRDASPLSIYVTMTMQWECVILKGLRSVLSSNTVHLLYQQYTEIIVSLVFEPKLVKSDVPSNQRCVYKVPICLREDVSLCLSVCLLSLHCFVFYAQR